MTEPPPSDSWADPAGPPSQPAPGPPQDPRWSNYSPYHPLPAPPGYGQPGAVPGYGYPPPKTNAMAVAAMVVSIGSAVALVCAVCFTLLAILPLGGGVTGAILGFAARRQIRDRGEQGDAMALAGIVVGFVAAALGVLGLLVTFVGIGFGVRNAWLQ